MKPTQTVQVTATNQQDIEGQTGEGQTEGHIVDDVSLPLDNRALYEATAMASIKTTNRFQPLSSDEEDEVVAPTPRERPLPPIIMRGRPVAASELIKSLKEYTNQFNIKYTSANTNIYIKN